MMRVLVTWGDSLCDLKVAGGEFVFGVNREVAIGGKAYDHKGSDRRPLCAVQKAEARDFATSYSSSFHLLQQTLVILLKDPVVRVKR